MAGIGNSGLPPGGNGEGNELPSDALFRDADDTDHQRWLLSYADFITLLCAFFIMLYAMSEVDRREGGSLLQSVQQSLDQLASGNAATDVPDVIEAPEAQPNKAGDTLDSASQVLADIRSGSDQAAEAHLQSVTQLFPEQADTSVIRTPDFVKIRIAGEFLFDGAGRPVSDQLVTAIRAVGAEIRQWPYRIRVEGHAMPATQGGSVDSWKASSDRAASVTMLLVESGVAPQRIESVGLGHHWMVSGRGAGWSGSGYEPDQQLVEVVLTRMSEEAITGSPAANP